MISSELEYILSSTDNYFNKALILAAYAHDGQEDKGGHPYILHPIQVASRLIDEDAKVVALLHDVVEDSSIADADLRQFFSNPICNAVEKLTKQSHISYSDYIDNISNNPLARLVKISDLLHNMDVSRVKPSQVDDKFIKNRQKYVDAYTKLSNGVDYASMAQF